MRTRRASHPLHPKRRESGFTLMEILIAMTILMIGLLPMLAVFQTALSNLNRAIEDTYASAIAQSVIDSIRLGLKEMKVEHTDGTRFFIFDHDGSEHLELDRKGLLRDMDITLASNKATLLGRDYTILLPNVNETEPAPSGGTAMGRAFLYPRKNPGDNQARRGVSYVQQKVTGADGRLIEGRKVRVEKVYHLGHKLTESTQEVERNDTYTQYSFAFTIRMAKAPDPLNPNPNVKQQQILPGLYEVVVMVYRNFNPNPDHKRNDTVGGPGREFITYVAE